MDGEMRISLRVVVVLILPVLHSKTMLVDKIYNACTHAANCACIAAYCWAITIGLKGICMN